MPTLNVTTSSTVVLPFRRRKALIIQNLSDTDIYVNFNAAVTIADGATAGLRLKADGGSISLPELSGAAGRANDMSVSAIHGGSGTKTLRYVEIL
jgi:hypothetical protein